MPAPTGPQWVFHGTQSKNARSIEKHGLRASTPTMSSTNEYGYENDTVDGYPKAVYFTDDMDWASEYGDAVYQVDSTKLDPNAWEYTDDESASAYGKDIPPNLVKRLK